MPHRSTIVFAAATLAAAAVAAATALAGATGANRTLTFASRAEPGNMAFDDLGAKGPQGQDIGDLLAFTHDLLVNGKQVGLIHVAAVGVDHKRHLSEAIGTIALPGGTITLSGLVSETPRFTLAVVGGTGSYAGERGTATISTSGPTSTLTINLTGS